MTLFEQVKECVTARQAAEHYGIKVKRNGMACCPFHKDRHPSMKADKIYHCFACGVGGDAIDFTARLNFSLIITTLDCFCFKGALFRGVLSYLLLFPTLISSPKSSTSFFAASYCDNPNNLAVKSIASPPTPHAKQ